MPFSIHAAAAVALRDRRPTMMAENTRDADMLEERERESLLLYSNTTIVDYSCVQNLSSFFWSSKHREPTFLFHFPGMKKSGEEKEEEKKGIR